MNNKYETIATIILIIVATINLVITFKEEKVKGAIFFFIFAIAVMTINLILETIGFPTNKILCAIQEFALLIPALILSLSYMYEIFANKKV